MKKIINIFLAITMLLTMFAVPVLAEDNITIYVNEQILQCEIAPYIQNGRTMVPMRKIFEALDAKVDWEGTTQTITATKGDIEIRLQINNATMKNNGVDEILDVPPVIVNSSTFVPIRAVSQSLKAEVEWLGHNQSVYINSPELFRQASEIVTKTIMMYSADGRTIDVLESEIEAYKNVGWYLTPVTNMYAPDGRTIVVSQDEVTAYLNVGWYETQSQAQAANRVTINSSNTSNPSADGHYYSTPTGKKYHLDPNCGGKNSRRTTNISGLSPCSKCAR